MKAKNLIRNDKNRLLTNYSGLNSAKPHEIKSDQLDFKADTDNKIIKWEYTSDL